MAFTALMFVILIVSYALMFGLVKFTENVITTPEFASERDDSSAETAGVDRAT